jgi:hypothetical protein
VTPGLRGLSLILLRGFARGIDGSSERSHGTISNKDLAPTGETQECTSGTCRQARLLATGTWARAHMRIDIFERIVD